MVEHLSVLVQPRGSGSILERQIQSIAPMALRQHRRDTALQVRQPCSGLGRDEHHLRVGGRCRFQFLVLLGIQQVQLVPGLDDRDALPLARVLGNS